MMRLSVTLLIAALACALLIGCGASTSTTAEPEIYDLHGKIVRIVPDDNTIFVDHDEIVGWMSAMTMEYPVADPADIERLSVGDEINAKVEVRDLDYRLADIEIVASGEPAESAEPTESDEPAGMDMDMGM